MYLQTNYINGEQQRQSEAQKQKIIVLQHTHIIHADMHIQKKQTYKLCDVEVEAYQIDFL